MSEVHICPLVYRYSGPGYRLSSFESSTSVYLLCNLGRLLYLSGLQLLCLHSGTDKNTHFLELLLIPLIFIESAMRLFGSGCISFSRMDVVPTRATRLGTCFLHELWPDMAGRMNTHCIFLSCFLPLLPWSSVHQHTSDRGTPDPSGTDEPASLSV